MSNHTPSRSLSASLQQINNDNPTPNNEGGFLSYLNNLTPWKSKRKRTEDETTPAADTTNANANTTNTTAITQREDPPPDNPEEGRRKKARTTPHRPTLATYPLNATTTSPYNTTTTHNTLGFNVGLSGRGKYYTSQRGRSSIPRNRTSRYRPRITGNYRPMGGLLTGRLPAPMSDELTKSISSQILQDAQGKLVKMALSKEGEEEIKFPSPVVRTVPRVRMQRVFGRGQTGGMGGSSAAANGVERNMSVPVARLEEGKAPPALRAPSVAVKPTTPAAKKAVTFQTTPVAEPHVTFRTKPAAATPYRPAESTSQLPEQTPHEEPTLTEEEPFVCQEMPSSLPMSPLKNADGLSKTVAEDIKKQVQSSEWQEKANSEDLGFGKDMMTPTPRKKRSSFGKGTPTVTAGSTPHPKKSKPSTPVETPMPTTPAPFGFMPTPSTTPVGYKYKDTETPAKTPSKAADLLKPALSQPTPSKQEASSESGGKAAPIGWGNLFKSTPGEWKCQSCLAKNPKEKEQCLCCEAPKDGGVPGKDDGQAAKADGNSTAKAEVKTDSNSSIGTGGFSFAATAAAPSTPAPAGGFAFPSTTPADKKSAVTSSGFKFGGSEPKAETKPPATPAPEKTSLPSTGFNFGQSKSETKADGGGFSFNSQTPKTPAPKAKSPAGFSFSAAKSETKPDESAPTGSTLFGFANAAPSNIAGMNSANDDKPSSLFGSTPAPEKKDATAEKSSTANATFSFSQAATSATTPATTKKETSATTFSFGQTATSASTPATTKKETPAPFAFGASATKTESAKPNTPAFNFGAATQAAPAQPNAPAFAFGGAQSSTTPAAAPGASFGSNKPAPAPAANFNFGATNTPAPGKTDTTPAATANFNFGASASTPAPGKTAFSFGAATNAPAPGFTPAPATTQPTPAPPATTPGTSFGMSSTPAPAAGGFAFGATPAPAKTNFAFGATNPSTSGFTPAPAPAGTFNFGQPTTPATGSFGMPNTTPAAPFGGGFGSTPAQPSFGATPAAATPAQPSFGATPGTGFSIGTSEKKTGRRIIKARRPGK